MGWGGGGSEDVRKALSSGVVGGARAVCLLAWWVLGWMGLLLVCDCGTEQAVSILGLCSNALTSA